MTRSLKSVFALAAIVWSATCLGQLPAPAPQQDPFENLISNAASFDLDSPVTVRAEFDPPVSPLGKRVVYRIEVTALDESLKVPEQLPAPAGLEFKAGGHAQIFQPTGARKMQPLTTFVFHVAVTNTGTFTMPAFDLLAYGKPVHVPPTTLNVVAASANALPEAPRLTLEIPEGDIYVGQLLHTTLMLPDNGDNTVHGFNKSHINGDFIFSEASPIGNRRETVQRNGKPVNAFLDEVLVTPLREGRQELIAQAYCFMTRPMPNQTNLMRTFLALIDSDPVTISVKGLPTKDRLPGFMGAVGNFSVEPPRLSATTARAGEPFMLALLIHGEGNIGRITPPQIPATSDWQTFPPTGETIPPQYLQQRGFAVFTYSVIPLNDRIKLTPAIPFSYFDPVKKSYVDATVPRVPIMVAPGVPEPTNATAIAIDDPANHDKEPVLTGLAAVTGKSASSLLPLQKQNWFLEFQAIPAIALSGLLLWDSRRRFREQHPEVILKRRARRGLRRYLRLARRDASSGNATGFAANAASALREACAPHTAANPQALVCADVLQELPATEISGRSGEVVRRLFAAADSMRFGGPNQKGSDVLTLQPELEQLLAQLKERL